MTRASGSCPASPTPGTAPAPQPPPPPLLPEDLPPANPTIELDLEKKFFRHGNMIDESRPPKTARPKAGKSKRADSSSSSSSKEGKSRRKKKEDRDGQVYPESRPQTAKTRYA